MSNKILDKNLEMKKIKLSQIKEREKTLIDIEEKEIQTEFAMNDVSVISKEAALQFLVLHPIVVTTHRKKNEGYYKIISGKRTYHIFNTIFNDDDNLLVLIIKTRNEDILRGISEADCVGTPFAYSSCGRHFLKNLLKRMKPVFLRLFPLLKNNNDIANIFGKTAETIFYNKNDRKTKGLEEIENNNSEDEKENISKRYETKRVE